MFPHDFSAFLGLRCLIPTGIHPTALLHSQASPSPSSGHQRAALLTNTLSTTAEQPSPPARSYLHPGGNAAQDPRGRAHTKLCSQSSCVRMGSRLEFFLAHLQKSQARLPTVHIQDIQHTKLTFLLFNLKPKACRMAISMLGKRFLEFNSCCQIQLASRLLKQHRNLPRQPSARETCAWASLSKDKHWSVEPEPRTRHPKLKLTSSLQGASHVWGETLSRTGSTAVSAKGDTYKRDTYISILEIEHGTVESHPMNPLWCLVSCQELSASKSPETVPREMARQTLCFSTGVPAILSSG